MKCIFIYIRYQNIGQNAQPLVEMVLKIYECIPSTMNFDDDSNLTIQVLQDAQWMTYHINVNGDRNASE